MKKCKNCTYLEILFGKIHGQRQLGVSSPLTGCSRAVGRRSWVLVDGVCHVERPLPSLWGRGSGVCPGSRGCGQHQSGGNCSAGRSRGSLSCRGLATRQTGRRAGNNNKLHKHLPDKDGKNYFKTPGLIKTHLRHFQQRISFKLRVFHTWLLMNELYPYCIQVL